MSYAPAALLFAALFLQGLTARAQINDKTIIHAGDSLSNYYTYLFPSFGDAVVKMRDGRSVIYKMNFNLLLSDMQFINPKGDTMVITNPADIDSILLDSCSFIYDYKKGYFQMLAVSDAVSLTVHRHTTFEPVPNGAMGAKSPTGGVEMLNSIANRQGTIPLVLDEDIYVLENTIFFLYYRGGGVENAGKAAFMRIYNGEKRSFDQFVKTNKIDFNKQGDLEKLFHFCIQSKM
jgi:hypothetical protein